MMSSRTPEKSFDFHLARGMFTESGAYKVQLNGGFTEYSPAYTVTNEDLRFVTGIKDVKNARVLTVAASGDHPLFYRLAGAESVDTFDLSYCARVAMDIKTAAISVLNRDDYIKMLYSMHYAVNVGQISSFHKIQDNLSRDVKEFISEMQGCKIFSGGLSASKYTEYLPTAAEYAELQKLINRPFTFQWSGIADIHQKLERTYDVMNLSNIFEYINETETMTGVLENLRPYLSDNGIIAVHTTWFFRNFELKRYAKVRENIKEWARLGMFKTERQQAIVMQKIR
jgi:hypothetical protein